MYYDYDDKKSDKIPYDKEPIYRQTNYNKRSSGSVGSNRRTLSIIVALMVVVQLGLIISLFITVGHFSNKIENLGTKSSTVVNINSSASNVDTVAIASKAKISAVCVHAGYTTTIEQDGSYYNRFFNMASKGAGVIIRDNKQAGVAYILTCYHVVKSSPSQVEVLLYDTFNPVSGIVVGYSTIYDLAVIKIEDSEYRNSTAGPCEVADSAMVVVGEPSVAIGNPLGMGTSITEGIINKKTDLIKVDNYVRRVMRTSAPTNNGNSGGGLFNAEGKLIGIVQAKSTDTVISNTNVYVDCMAYAIPSTLAVGLADNIIKNGDPVKAVLGITMAVENSGIKYDYINGKDIPVETILVAEVDYDSPLYGKIDIDYQITAFKYGDTIVNMTNMYSFEDHSFSIHKGDKVTIYYINGSTPGQVEITIEKDISADYQDWYK